MLRIGSLRPAIGSWSCNCVAREVFAAPRAPPCRRSGTKRGAMNKHEGVASARAEWVGDNAASVAESVEKDFSGLIEIFGSQLASSADVEDAAKSAISEAKAAAERGLKLSRQLIELLRG